ncbi:P-loop containing nucleoside triphosphate hydrolase protein [Xylariaceae sp. AK1471]|nr:P-loop containing nucleoside triphosphate hydrolase protein [Xylariaceae sp. AK1471]
MSIQSKTVKFSDKVKQVKNRCPECTIKTARKLLHEFRGHKDDVSRCVTYFLIWGNDTTHISLCNDLDDTNIGSTLSFETDDSEMPVDLSGYEPCITPTCYNRWGRLPRISAPYGLTPAGSHSPDELLVEEVIGAIQLGESAEVIQKHLAYYYDLDDEKLRTSMNAVVKGFPAIFYLVETDNVHMIRCWVKYGGGLNATCGPDHCPLLAFAILHGRNTRTLQQATSTLEMLLTLGASPCVIPQDFYTPFNRSLPASGLVNEVLDDMTEQKQRWCDPRLRKELMSALNLTQRYRLFQATHMGSPSRRQQILASRTDAERILGLQYTVIGQEAAVKALKRRLMAQLALATEKPLVFIFAGPSGHGKTEIARSLGELISTDMISIDCTTFNREDELFGSPLNNFLARKSGSRCIVFMDEFEKTNKEIHNTLLIPFDQGEYLDRRNSNKIDCSRTIWILATNKFDDYILEFCDANQHGLFESRNEKDKARLLDQLKSYLKRECMSHFGHPLAGRVSEIVPFLTFSPDEQAVVSHKGMMGLEATLRRPVVVSPSGQDDNLVGNVRLDVENESKICSTIAHEGYSPQLGARSVFNAITEAIYTPLVNQYLEVDDEFSEDQPETTFKVGINADKGIEVWHVQRKTDRNEN